METTIKLVGIIITLPFIALEAMIKGIMCILYFPLTLGIAIIYPLIKRKDLNWTEKWWEYATTWKKGFYSGYIYKLWKVEATIDSRFEWEQLISDLKACGIPCNYIDIDKYILINCYCATQRESAAVKKSLDRYNAKYFVTESKTL